MANSSIWLRAAVVLESPTLRNTAGAITAASVAMIAMTTSSSISVNPARRARAWRSALDDTEHLVDRGESCLDLAPAVGAERRRAALLGHRAQLRAAGASG